MKILIALGFLIAVSASPLANFPSKDVAVSPIEDFPLLEQLSEQDERKKTSEIILEAIIASLDKIQGEIINVDNQKINEGIQGILNTIQNILKNRGKEEVRADFVLDDSQQYQYDVKETELPQNSPPAQEISDNENKINESDKVLDSEQNEEDSSKVKFIDMVPQKKVSDQAKLSKVAENHDQTANTAELLQEQILDDISLRQPQEIQYIPSWLNRQPAPY